MAWASSVVRAAAFTGSNHWPSIARVLDPVSTSTVTGVAAAPTVIVQV
jgi:hypothetical protein